MAKGWKISTVRPGRGASGALRQELFLVAISDKVEAVRAVQECLPDAEVKIGSQFEYPCGISGQRRRNVGSPRGLVTPRVRLCGKTNRLSLPLSSEA